MPWTHKGTEGLGSAHDRYLQYLADRLAMASPVDGVAHRATGREEPSCMVPCEGGCPLRIKNSTIRNRAVLLLGQTWLWAVANASVLGVIFFISTWRTPPGSDASGDGAYGAWFAITAHLTMYAALAVVLAGLLLSWGRTRRLWIILGASFAGAVAYGAAMEIVQRFIPGRVGAWEDVGWDALGAGTALAMVHLVLTGWRTKRRPFS